MKDVVSRRGAPPPQDPGTGPDRRVTVAGVSGGVGTTTLAAALGGIDRHVFVGRPVDVLVCRGTVDSLQRAGQAARLQTDARGRPPLLAVLATEPGRPSRGVTARLRLTSAYTTRTVTVPLVRRWRESTTCLQDARSIRTTGPAELPRALRGYARAVGELRRHLHRPATPTPARRTRRLSTTPVRVR